MPLVFAGDTMLRVDENDNNRFWWWMKRSHPRISKILAADDDGGELEDLEASLFGEENRQRAIHGRTVRTDF